MARDKSAVLSAADRKAVVTDLKARIKATKDAVKTGNAEVKALQKTYDASIKAVTKDFQTAVKGVQKDLDTNSKALAKLEAELEAIVQAA